MDPVLVYDGETVHATDSAAATVLVDAPAHARTGGSFWVRAGVDVESGTLLNFSGSFYYDSTLVRPTGRIQDPYDEVRISEMRDGSARTTECETAPSAAHVAIGGISWSHRPRERRFGDFKADFKLEFTAIAAGTAVFAWTDTIANCVEATVADGNYDRKPAGIIWEIEDDYHAAIATDTANYSMVSSSTIITGDTKGKGDFFASNPESLQTAITLLPASISAAKYDNVTVTVSDWFPYAIANNDSIGFTLVWEANELLLVNIQPRPGWKTSAVRVLPQDEPGVDTLQVIDGGDRRVLGSDGYIDWTMLSGGVTAICGLDSAAAKVMWFTQGGWRALKPDGPIVDVTFLVLRDGNATVKLGCQMVEDDVIDAERFVPSGAVLSTADRSRERWPMLQLETQQRWLWRHGVINQTTVIE